MRTEIALRLNRSCRVATDRVALCIDRVDGFVHRMRFTLEGFAGTRGAVAEVDSFERARRFGVTWPMRFTGLDVNRGYAANDLSGVSFTGAAAAPARPL